MNENDLWLKVSQEETAEACKNYLSLFPTGAHAKDVSNKLKILEECNKIPAMFLKRYVQQQLISVEALVRAGLDNSKVEALQASMGVNVEELRKQREEEQQRQQAEALRRQMEAKLREEEERKRREEEERLREEEERRREEEERQREEEARRREARRDIERVLTMLQEDPNALDALRIQQLINDQALTYEELESIFGHRKTEEIMNYIEPSKLPENEAPIELSENSTEVYFWGTPSSGKTCALGGIISSAESKGILEKLQCNGYNYMTRLSNIFDSKRVCTFPDSTSVETIQDMMMRLTDTKGKNHRVTLVDLAGELFRSVYFKRHDLFLENTKQETLERTMSYLRDTRNKKIHFFVVEYGAHDLEWEGLRMKDYLSDMVGFLEEENVFRKSTVGVYVLVTKCDKIDCQRLDRPRLAYEYVERELAAFWSPLERVCRRNGVGDLKVLSYSVGDVFAKKLCLFDPIDTEKVIDKLLTKTPAEGGRWEWLKG